MTLTWDYQATTPVMDATGILVKNESEPDLFSFDHIEEWFISYYVNVSVVKRESRSIRIADAGHCLLTERWRPLVFTLMIMDVVLSLLLRAPVLPLLDVWWRTTFRSTDVLVQFVCDGRTVESTWCTEQLDCILAVLYYAGRWINQFWIP